MGVMVLADEIVDRALGDLSNYTSKNPKYKTINDVLKFIAGEAGVEVKDVKDK